MIFVGRSELVLASGWLMVALALISWLPVTEVAICLVTLIFAETFAAIVTPRADVRHAQRVCDTSRNVERIMITWLVLLGALGLALHSATVEIFEQSQLAALCLAALCLLTPLLIMCQRLASQLSVLIPSRLLLLSAVALVLERLGVQSGETFLLAAVMLFLVLALVAFQPLLHAIRQNGPKTSGFDIHLALATTLRRIDILVVPLVLSAPSAFTYLIARGLTGILVGTLDQLVNKAFLSMACNNNPANLRVAEAARLNLGIFLVGGAVAVALMGALPIISGQLGNHAAEVYSITGWLVLGALGPAIFGAAPAFLRLAEYDRELTLLVGLTIVSVLTLVAISPDQSAVSLAQRIAIAQLSFAGLTAILLALRTGIWPGLTAIMFKQIKLF